MKSEKVLQMLNNGEVEGLKALLQDEIYLGNLNSSKGEKQRYQAMKRYFRFNLGNIKESLQKPCKIGEYYSFLDGFSVTLTNESIGEIKEYDNKNNDYFKVEQLMSVNGATERINLNEVLAHAKSNGYKFKKNEIGNSQDFNYVLKYKDSFYKIGILDQAYSIINDGEVADVTYQKALAPLLIKTKIGKCIILPVHANSITKQFIIELDSEGNIEIA